MTIVDLTALVTDKMPVFPGDPHYRKEWHTYYESYPVCCSILTLGPHTGTHVDAPLHFIKGGQSIDQMPIETFTGRALCIDCRSVSQGDIAVEHLKSVAIERDDIVLLFTGWQSRSGKPEFFEMAWPGVSIEAADYLVGLGIKAIGTDTPSIDSIKGLGSGAPAHMAFLGASMPIIESLVNLDKIMNRQVTFTALPLKLEGCEASPVRAIAVLT